MEADGILGPCRGRRPGWCAIFMEFLYLAPLSSLEFICCIRDTQSFEHFQAKQAPVRLEIALEGSSMMSFALDFVFVAIGVAAFAATALYLNACASL